MYVALLKEKWTLPQIDEMDVHYYFDLMEHAEKQESEPNAYIDQVPGL